MAARRCSRCSIDWPPGYIKQTGGMRPIYRCPACEGDTSSMNNVEPITVSEAHHAAFEGYYKRRGEKRAAEAEKAFKLLAEQSKEIADLPEAETA